MGKFIVIDGPDGVGKTTIINVLKEQISKTEDSDKYCFLYDQYTKDDICKQIKQIIITQGNSLDNSTLALLSLVARTRLNKIIKEELANDKIIICDRYISSTLVLNTNTNEDMYDILMVSKMIEDSYIKPDMYIILLYGNERDFKEPSDNMELKMLPKEQQKKFLQLKELLENVNYIYLDHSKDILDNVFPIFTLLSKLP